jgi:hypothetical protein
MAVGAITQSSFGSLAATAAGSTQALPGTGTTLVVTNMGPSPASVKLGTSASPTQPDATQASGTVVMNGETKFFTVGANTYISATALGFGTAVLNLTQGTVA